MKRGMSFIPGAVGMLVLILDSKTSLQGAAEGLDLCIRTVIPSLFPFLFLSNLLIGGYTGNGTSRFSFLGRLFSLPNGMEGMLIPAFFGGYPVGAQCIGNAYANRLISKENAQHMLTFCSNAGPSFLFGMLSGSFYQKWMVWALWGIQIVSALLVASLFSTGIRENSPGITQKNDKPVMVRAVSVMGQICGWVILFRVLISFGNRWFFRFLPKAVSVAVMGMLELTNGCCALGVIGEIPLRFILCAGMLSFGGICVGMQTASVIGELSMGSYWTGKGLQTLFSILLAATVMGKFWAIGILMLIYGPLLSLKSRKNSSIFAPVGV